MVRKSHPYVYDKAKYHYSGDYPSELSQFQAFVHTGMFIGWLADNNLFDEEFMADAKDDIVKFRERLITGAQLYESLDGVLEENMLNPEGNAFALYYFDFDNGVYMDDYNRVLVQGLPSEYHVADTWENYDKIKTIIYERYITWLRDAKKDGRQ